MRPSTTGADGLPDIPRPGRDEYDRYYEGYVEQAGSGNVVAVLQRQRKETLSLLSSIEEDRGDYRYEPGKWSVKEVFGHLVDVERIFAGRALWFARGQSAPLPDMDADACVDGAGFDRWTLADLAADYDAARGATITFFCTLPESDLTRRGTAAECQFSVRAIAYILAGHERHHLRLLEDRYGLR